MANEQRKDYSKIEATAKILYLKGNLTQKEMAEQLGVAPKTIGEWKDKGRWEELKTANIITREEELRRLNIMLKSINDLIIEQQKGIPSSAQADNINKIAGAIRKLQTEAGIAEIVDVATEMVNHYKHQDLETAKLLTDLFNGFIQSKIK